MPEANKLIQDEPEERNVRATIGVVCALQLEAAPLLDQLPPQRTQSGNGLKFYDCYWNDLRIVVVVGGVGERRAKAATHALIDAVSPSWILSVGLSGALVESLQIGDVILGNGFIRKNGREEILQDFDFPDDLEKRLFVGKLCTADHIVRAREDKRELHERTKALAVDMESFAVAKTTRDRGVGLMAIRAISDDVSRDLPKEILAIFGPKGTIRTGALVGTILKRPGSVKDLWAIRENAVLAAKNLAAATLDLIPLLVRCD